MPSADADAAESAAGADADAALQANIDAASAASDAADAELASGLDDNEFRMAATAADLGFDHLAAVCPRAMDCSHPLDKSARLAEAQ